MKRTFAPPEHDAQLATAAAPARVLPAASASIVRGPPPLGVTRTSRVSPGRSVALYESAMTPRSDPDHRSTTCALPEKPTWGHVTLTVEVPLVAVLNSATMESP